jgi:glucose/arabinose dehydrogenase
VQDATVWLHTGAHGTPYIAEVGRLLRIDGIDARLDDPPKPQLVTDQLPKEGWHGWRYISFGPDGWRRAQPRVKPGLHVGFPYCHQGNLLDPAFGKGKSCASYEPPARVLGAHVGALGMRFYTGKMFPEKYRSSIILAEHGSWNRERRSGYRVMAAQVEADRVVAYEPLVSGAADEASGRPVDVETLDDGSLLVSDDYRGAVYRVTTKREPERQGPPRAGCSSPSLRSVQSPGFSIRVGEGSGSWMAVVRFSDTTMNAS